MKFIIFFLLINNVKAWIDDYPCEKEWEDGVPCEPEWVFSISKQYNYLIERARLLQKPEKIIVNKILNELLNNKDKVIDKDEDEDMYFVLVDVGYELFKLYNINMERVVVQLLNLNLPVEIIKITQYEKYITRYEKYDILKLYYKLRQVD